MLTKFARTFFSDVDTRKVKLQVAYQLLTQNGWVMTMNTTAMPGYRVYEYLVVLPLAEALRQKVMMVRKSFSDSYKTPMNWMSKPYIGLAKFKQYAMMEERLLNRLRTVTMGHHPFKVQLQNFGSFPSHTIYIGVANKGPVQELVKSIRSEAQRLMKSSDTEKPYFMLEPTVTIANKLKPWQYEQGWAEYSQKSFSGQCIADAVLVLKRPEGGVAWQIVERMELKNMPVLVKQGDLWGMVA